MELIAASRIVKAQNRVTASKPYAEAITAVVSAVASQTAVAHPLTTPRDNPRRAAVLLVSSDRGLAGAYSASVLRMGEELNALLRSEGKEPIAYLTGRKAASYYRFRGREIAGQWTGFSEEPTFEAAKEAAEELIAAFVRGSDNEVAGVDEIHIVYTEYVSALTQRPVAKRVLPLAVEYTEEAPPSGPLPLYEFEPSGEGVLDALLPRYVISRFYAAMLESAASEQAARRRAMKAATDNADELVKALTRAANSARQAEITQEIMEIVGGAEALSSDGSRD
jgi:F-type H+-transporting ATPase subunit gamma